MKRRSWRGGISWKGGGGGGGGEGGGRGWVGGQGWGWGQLPPKIGQWEMVHSSDNNVDTMVHDQPIVLPEQSPEISEHTSWPQHAPPAPQPHTSEPLPWPCPDEKYPRYPSLRCHSPSGVPWSGGRWGANQSSHCRAHDGCGAQDRVASLPFSFPLV